MNKDKLFSAFIWVLVGAVLATILCIIIELHQPTKPVKNCNDGWSTQVEDGKVYRTYLPAEDTCKKGGN